MTTLKELQALARDIKAQTGTVAMEYQPYRRGVERLCDFIMSIEGEPRFIIECSDPDKLRKVCVSNPPPFKGNESIWNTTKPKPPTP